LRVLLPLQPSGSGCLRESPNPPVSQLAGRFHAPRMGSGEGSSVHDNHKAHYINFLAVFAVFEVSFCWIALFKIVWVIGKPKRPYLRALRRAIATFFTIGLALRWRIFAGFLEERVLAEGLADILFDSGLVFLSGPAFFFLGISSLMWGSWTSFSKVCSSEWAF